jgi:hypothetical protein
MATLSDLRGVALALPRRYERLVRDWVKFEAWCLVVPKRVAAESVAAHGLAGR